MIKILLTSAIMFATLSACVSTDVRDFTDPKYVTNYKVSKVIVRAPNASLTFGTALENSIVKQLTSSGVEAVSFLSMFPPTRSYEQSVIKAKVVEQQFNGVMYVNITGANADSSVIGYSSNSNATFQNNMISSSTTTTPIIGFRRNTFLNVKLYEPKSSDVIWLADTATNAGGCSIHGG